MTAFGHIIEDSWWLATSLRRVSFSHVRRNGNRVADKFAKLTKFLYEPQIWIEDIHRDVTDYVTLDRRVIKFLELILKKRKEKKRSVIQPSIFGRA